MLVLVTTMTVRFTVPASLRSSGSSATVLLRHRIGGLVLAEKRIVLDSSETEISLFSRVLLIGFLVVDHHGRFRADTRSSFVCSCHVNRQDIARVHR